MAKIKVPGGHMVGLIPEDKKGKKPATGKKPEETNKPPAQGQ